MSARLIGTKTGFSLWPRRAARWDSISRKEQIFSFAVLRPSRSIWSCAAASSFDAMENRRRCILGNSSSSASIFLRGKRQSEALVTVSAV